MGLNKTAKWLSLLANISVVANIVFLALEIRTDTSTNNIAILHNYSANWMHLHDLLAENRDLAELVNRALSGGELDSTDSLQIQRWALQFVSQSHDMLRHYDAGLISESQLRPTFNNIRDMAKNPRFRTTLIEAGFNEDQRLGGLISAEHGYSRWLHRSH